MYLWIHYSFTLAAKPGYDYYRIRLCRCICEIIHKHNILFYCASSNLYFYWTAYASDDTLIAVRKHNAPPSPNYELAMKSQHPSQESQHLHGRRPAAVRLNKAIAQSGLCSRRKADDLIFSGEVKVNGIVATDASIKVLPTDKVEVHGKLLSGQQDLRYIMLHKPPQTICTVSDPEGRKTVLDLLPASLRRRRLYPVGRLDYFSEGLLLLTNDGQLAQKLMHPSHGQVKIYEALIRGAVSEAALGAIRRGMTLTDVNGAKGPRDIATRPAPTSAQPLPTGDTLLTIELRQGVNRQIRRMCDQLGLTILRLKRVAQGALKLGDLPRGQFRELNANEVKALRGFGSGHEKPSSLPL